MALITEQDDRTLVEQHRAGDHDAFRHIVVRHHRSLYANALRRLGDPVLAEDAVQEAFLRAFRNLERFEGEYHLDAWLHRIVTNTCHDIGRRQGRDTRLFDRACSTVEVEAPAADDAFEVLPATDVSQALDALPASYREVLMLRFVEELSYSDVALKAGISEENARARVSRGRNMLKRMLSSTSALVIWAIPPLRRTQVQLDPDAAVQGAQQVHNVTGITNAVSTVHTAPGFGQLTNLVAQAGPTIATAAPSVTSTGPVVKAAVAAGLAAAVAIPTGVAVDRAREKPPRQSPAPLIEESPELTDPSAPVVTEPKSATAPTTVAEPKVGAASVGSPTLADPLSGADKATGSSTTTETTTPTSTTSPSTSVLPSTDTSAPPPSSPPPSEQPPQEQPAPAPAPPVGTLTASSLQVEEAGPNRVSIRGPITLRVGDQTFSGEIEGKPYLGEPAPKDPRREVNDRLKLTVDGKTYELQVAGFATVTEQGNTRTLDLDLRYALPGGAELGLAEQDSLSGKLTLGKSTGSLELTLPGAPRAS